MARPTISLEDRQMKLNTLLQDLSDITMVYAEKPTPSNKVKLLNLQNRIRHERVRVNRAKLHTKSDRESIQI
jgi:hypothetical protein